MTEEEFAAKVDHEGGIVDALVYGLKSNDLEDQDSDLAKAWRNLENAWRSQFYPLIAEAEALLPEETW